jgi:hypothetical protein
MAGLREVLTVGVLQTITSALKGRKVPTMPFQIDKQGNATLTKTATGWDVDQPVRILGDNGAIVGCDTLKYSIQSGLKDADVQGIVDKALEAQKVTFLATWEEKAKVQAIADAASLNPA